MTDVTFSCGGVVVLQMEKQVIESEIAASRRLWAILFMTNGLMWNRNRLIKDKYDGITLWQVRELTASLKRRVNGIVRNLFPLA